MDFFEEDDAPERPEPRRAARGSAASGDGPSRRQQFLVRRLIALAGGIVILILLVLAVRGCLNAREERAFENYVSDLSSLAGDSNQLSDQFFNRLQDEGDDSDLSLQSAVNNDRGTAQSLADRARELDAPDDVKGPQAQVALAFELRSDAMTTIADRLPTAVGDGNQATKATKQITKQMETLLASDILYARSRDQIESVLDDKEISIPDGIQKSRFLPSTEYLNEDFVAEQLTGASSGSGNGGEEADDNLVHGLGLISTTIGGTALTAGTPVTVSAGRNVEVEVEVQNQGEEGADESDVAVEATISGGGSDSSGNETIPSIAAGATETVTIPLTPAPPTGQQLTLDVRVEPVPGEQEETNNEASYTVTFE